MMLRTAAVTTALLFVVGCDPPGVCDGTELAAASTPSEEAAAMERFWEHCAPLSMSAHDASGGRLSFSDPDWMTKVHRVSIRGDGGPRFDHRVIDADNLGILMRE